MTDNIGTLLTQSGVPISGPQMALADWTKGQGDISNAAKFAQGMGASTNLTYADTGPAAGHALETGQESLANTAAMTNFLNTQFQNLAGGLGSILGK
jgi:hypothetical protein